MGAKRLRMMQMTAERIKNLVSRMFRMILAPKEVRRYPRSGREYDYAGTDALEHRELQASEASLTKCSLHEHGDHRPLAESYQ